MRDKCNEHIKYEFDLLSISILISDIEIITNIDLNKGYCLKKYNGFKAYRIQNYQIGN